MRALLSSALIATTLGAQSPVIRDSSGIRIVENDSRRAAPVAFTLGREPLLDVGGAEADPDQEFDHRQGYLRGVRLSDGRLVVIDVKRVHFFSPSGSRLKIVGRAGSGPEEFQYLTAICRTHGDTIVVADAHNRRLSVIDGDGEIVRTILLGDLGSPPFNACFDDGTFLLSRPVGELIGGARMTRLTRVRLDGSVAGVIGEFLDTPFNFVTQTEVSLVAANRRLFYANSADHQVLVLGLDGKPIQIVRNRDPRIAITDADVTEQIERSVPTNVLGAARSKQIDRLRAMPRPSTWPAYRRAHVDAAGRLWLQTYQTQRAAGDSWIAYDPEGRMIGLLEIRPPGSARLEVIGFGLNDVLVRRFDADQASYLTVYRIQSIDGRRR
jgi:hypothetical protein